jgi:ribosomal protein L37E
MLDLIYSILAVLIIIIIAFLPAFCPVDNKLDCQHCGAKDFEIKNISGKSLYKCRRCGKQKIYQV